MNPISLVVVFVAVACVWSAAVEPVNGEEMEEEGLGPATAALAAAVSTGELAIKIRDRYNALLDAHCGANDLKDRGRSLELVIANDSEYKLTFAAQYIHCGTYFSYPEPYIEPGDATIATVASRQGSWFTGVTGGMSWRIGDTGKYLTIGFANPFWGRYKTWIGVLDRKDAEYGYQQARDESLKRISSNGFALLAQLKTSDIADRRFLFGITDE